MGRLEDKTAIVTGAGQGLGLAIAELFAKEGAKVVGTGRHVEKVEKAFAAIRAAHPEYELTAMQHDVASKEEWEKIAADTAAKYGSVDVVVNNAAIMAMKGILDASSEEFLSVFKTNCLAVLLSIQAVVPYMEKAGKGSIVNIDSIGGLTSGDADGGDATYSASKGGTRALTKNAAIQLAAKNIRVNTVHPGGILTEMLKAVYAATPALWDRVKETSPLAPHVADPIDIANGVLFLASDESRCMTGSELVIDCGYMAH
ncbi:MAG: SDR family oxidoreductase [Clostridia bacterium]|nr:SDR family oxidoreductase [Clostridia bacterium]